MRQAGIVDVLEETPVVSTISSYSNARMSSTAFEVVTCKWISDRCQPDVGTKSASTQDHFDEHLKEPQILQGPDLLHDIRKHVIEYGVPGIFRVQDPVFVPDAIVVHPVLVVEEIS
jgi:hypothetical protein